MERIGQTNNTTIAGYSRAISAKPIQPIGKTDKAIGIGFSAARTRQPITSHNVSPEPGKQYNQVISSSYNVFDGTNESRTGKQGPERRASTGEQGANGRDKHHRMAGPGESGAGWGMVGTFL